MITNQTRKRRVRLLERRLAHLDERIDTRGDGYKGDSYDIAEAYALEWALGIIRNGMESGQIIALEEHEPQIGGDEGENGGD